MLDDDGRLLVGCVDDSRADLCVVDELLRLELAARRAGRRLLVRGATPSLRGLLGLLGLSGVLTLEAGGQLELGEQLVVADEVVQARDPPA